MSPKERALLLLLGVLPSWLVCWYGPRRSAFCMEGCPVVRLIFFVWVWVDGALELGWSFSENADWRPASFPVYVQLNQHRQLGLIWDLYPLMGIPCAVWTEGWLQPQGGSGSSLAARARSSAQRQMCLCENMVTRIISVCLSQSGPLNQRYLLSPTIAL